MLCVFFLCLVGLVAGGSVDMEVNITKVTNGHTTLFESEPFMLSITLLRWPSHHDQSVEVMCVAARGGDVHSMTLIGTRCVQVSKKTALSDGPIVMILRFNLGTARRAPYTLTVSLGDVDVPTNSDLRLRVVAHHYPDSVYLLPTTPITITVPPRRSFVLATPVLSETTTTSMTVTLHTGSGDVDYFVFGDAPDDAPNTWQVPWSRGFSTNGIVAVYNNATVRGVTGRVYVVIFGHEGYLSSRVNVSAVVEEGGGDHSPHDLSSNLPPAVASRWDTLWWALSILMEILAA